MVAWQLLERELELGTKEEPLFFLLHKFVEVEEVSQRAANGDLKARAFSLLRDSYETQSQSRYET